MNINLNKIDLKYNRNVLHYICMRNSKKNEINFHKFEKYLNLDVSLTQKDILGRNPLFYLFLDKENKIKENEDPISSLSYLLDSYENKINLNKRNKNKNDILDLNITDILGNSLIFYAVLSNASFCVSYLLSKGANIKGIKNKENNNIFSYALLGNSSSIQELYNEVNDIKVFEDKLYKINKEPIETIINNTIKDKNEKINDKNKIKQNSYCAEELFNINYNKNIKNPEKEVDNNLEKLYQENDEGAELISNSYNSDSYDEDNDYGNDEESEGSFDFKEQSESKDEKSNDNSNDMDVDNEDDDMEEDSSNNEEDDDENNESENNSESDNVSKKLAKVSDIYSFNYSPKLKKIISKYIPKNLGDNNSHYENNYIPTEKYKTIIKNYPDINSVKYKLSISEDKSKSKNEQEKNENKIISDSLFKYCIENNSQNIIYYILNKGYDEFHAISDALSSGKYDFALILLERFSSISLNKLKMKNEKGQNLLHILCNKKYKKEDGTTKNDIIIKKILEILIDKVKLKKNELDNDMHSPLYYIVQNSNLFILPYLYEDFSNKDENKLFIQKDKNNITPLFLLEEKLFDDSLSEEFINFILIIIYKIVFETKTAYLKSISKYILKNFNEKDLENITDDKIDEHIPNGIKVFYIFKIIIEHKICDINSDIDDKGNNIFLKCAIKNKYALFNKLMECARKYKTKIDYNKVNKEGKSLIHYIINPHTLYSYQNIIFLKDAIKSGFNINIKDKNGLTPLDYAKKYNYENMINILIKNNAIQSKQKIENFMEIEEEENNNLNDINYDYKKISEKYYKEKIEPFIIITKPKQDQSKALVTKNCELIVQNYSVYKDNNGNLYNVNLSKVDIKKNLYNKYVYYQIQLLVNEKRNIYNLITRWGQYGEEGQYQNTPFTDINEAIKEFNKIFYSKTKNNWEIIKDNFDAYEKKIKKYELVKLTDKKPEINNIIDYFNDELKNINIKITKDRLNPNTKEFILYLIQKSFSEKIGRYNSYDDDEDDDDNNKCRKFNVLYFSKESLNKGLNILSQLAELNDKLNDLEEKIKNEKISEKILENENSSYNRNKREFHEVSQQILNLSNEFYEIIPFDNYRYNSITPINRPNIIKEEMNRILSYTYIEDTLQLFLSSLYYTHKIDPINYIYKSLNKKIIPLNLDITSKNNKDKTIVKILLDYIRLYKKSRKTITNIFEIEDNNKNELGNDYKKRILLFHGTKAENVLGILSKGLIIAPIEAESSGNRYGSGIYLSDQFNKALDYCSGDKKYVLVVDTFLDKPFKIGKNNKFKGIKNLKKNKYNCLINNTRVHITEERIYLINGTSVPTSIVQEKNDGGHYYDYDYDYDSEYVIYDSKFVNVKYIIELED